MTHSCKKNQTNKKTVLPTGVTKCMRGVQTCLICIIQGCSGVDKITGTPHGFRKIGKHNHLK